MPRQQRRAVTPSTATLAVLALVAVLVPASPAHAQDSAAAIESELAYRLNAERTARGLRPLRIDVRLVDSARSWSQHMRRDGRLSHDPNLARTVPSGVTAIAENVGRTQATTDVARRLHNLFMSSAPHRSNILSSRYRELGIGVVTGGGWTYTTQRLTAGAPARVAAAVTPTARLAERLFDGGRASHAVIARDSVYADALAAGPLAGDEGPVLLTPTGPVVHPRVRLALERTLPRGRTIWIVGGSAAVPGSVQRELTDAGWRVERVGGGNRIDTAARVSRRVASRSGRDEMLVATAATWPDAAAGGAYGAHRGAPIVLGLRDRVPAETAAVLSDLGPTRVAALGGSRVLGDRVVETLNAERIAGATREATASALAERLWGYADATPRTWIAVPGFGADAWTWALSAAPLAARHNAPVLLVGDTVAPDLRDYLAGLGYGGDSRAQLVTHGPVPTAARDELNRLLGN